MSIDEVLKNVRKASPAPKKDKAISQKIHALRRFRERYGQSLTEKQYKELCSLVMQGKTTVIEKQSLRVSRRKVTYNGIDIYFCYDHKRHKINTFLKPEWVIGIYKNIDADKEGLDE
jgi:hypothetical protein